MVIRHSIRIWDGILGYRFGDVGVKRLFTAAVFELVSRTTIYPVTEPTKDIQPPFHKAVRHSNPGFGDCPSLLFCRVNECRAEPGY